MYLYHRRLKRYASYNRATHQVSYTTERGQATSLTEKECKKLLEKCTKKLKEYTPIEENAEEATVKKLSAGRSQKTERLEVYTRDRGICGICGAFVPPNELTIDHIMPISKGGTYALDNLQCCCRRCNQLKADALPEDFLNLVASITEYQITEKANKKMRKHLKKALKKSKKRKPKKKGRKK